MQIIHRCQGFTLIEMIITLSILSILTAYGIPNYRELKQNQTMTQEINRLSSTINFARSHSIIAGDHVILCATQTFTACDGNSQWHNGWMVFADANQDRRFNGNDRMLLIENSMSPQLQALASVHRPTIRFNSVGFAPGTNLTIRFCDDRGAAHGKAIIISNVGRPRIAQHISSCG
ncbi:hypothetical protein MNBD_GAMMA02-1181 [hydrothermal vent metagenome]|uniref:General secretion pathway GspH domain-containing protein n=1 Tax=hydrothermal vent metagenome TaxID=652676 RepID=A0A3B0W490_9ZZZZ